MHIPIGHSRAGAHAPLVATPMIAPEPAVHPLTADAAYLGEHAMPMLSARSGGRQRCRSGRDKMSR